ncbi:hypothetical protein [Streptomyces sp. NPDC088183]|uniref:hypothetical protein n=1 Tax=unclassified Streptomyces TaxID=2593676 RepID=UPI0034461DBA
MALVLPLAVAVPASAAAPVAAACSSPSWVPWDSGYAFSVGGKTSPLRTGPYSGCGTRVTLPANTELDIDCRIYNTVPNLWYHVSAYVNGSRYEGWIYSANVGAIYESNDQWC